jgi:hypothetical protein
MLVGLTPEMFRCMSCGADLRQHINGKISYIPNNIDPKNTFLKLTEVSDGQES